MHNQNKLVAAIVSLSLGAFFSIQLSTLASANTLPVTTKPVIHQFFTAENIKLEQKNEKVANNVATENAKNKAKGIAVEIDPVVIKVPYTAYIKTPKNELISIHQGKQLLFKKKSSNGTLFLNTKKWRSFKPYNRIKVYALMPNHKLSKPTYFKFATSKSVLQSTTTSK